MRFRRRPVVIVSQRDGSRQEPGAGIRRIEIQRSLNLRPHEWGDLPHGKDPVHAAGEITQRELGVRIAVLRIERDRLLEQALRPVPCIRRELGKVRPAAQECFVSRQAGLVVTRAGAVSTELALECIGDGGRDFVLHREHVGHRPVISFRPYWSRRAPAQCGEHLRFSP
jgi:hypothetical protein